MKSYILILFIFHISLFTFSQNNVKGEVYGLENNKKIPLYNASVFWLNTSTGTITGDNGKFSISRNENSDLLICSYLGYKSDTILVNENQSSVKFVLKPTLTLSEAEVTERSESSYISKMEPIHTQKIEGHELKKAACCNLSESFETNASVDVHYSDALTGAKQIQLLGLAGIYSQIMTEKVPHVRGLSVPYGLGYIPGSWMESIQVSKGTASVESGFESITGQINVEYKKPDSKEVFYFNAL
ncbi:MAG: carboxypeptidase-like regulatory domain-containing protein, partial [Bacteroidota bacterium]